MNEKPQFYSYEEWIKLNPDLLEQEKDCDECMGTGKKECSNCGQDIECEDCEGTGKINSARNVYEMQLKKEKERLKKLERC